jgi:hypothetical protein
LSDAPNSDQIRQITEHPYFQTLVKEQVRERVNAQWDQTRNVLAPALAVLLAAASFYGYTSISGLNEKKKELEVNVEKKIAELNDAVKQVKSQADTVVGQAKEASEKAQTATTEIGLSKDFARAILDQLQFATTQAENSILRTHEDLKHEMETFDAKQATASLQAQQLLAKLDEEDASIAKKKRELDDAVSKAAEGFEGTTKVRTVLESEQAEFQKANLDLLKATQVQYLLIHSDSVRQMTVYAAARPDGKDQTGRGSVLQRVDLEFRTGRVRPGIPIRIAVLQGSDGKAGSDSEYPLAEGVRSPIKGVPFDYQVDFIYHATILTHHFAVIRVIPHDAVVVSTQ